jgi:hypothetical protein
MARILELRGDASLADEGVKTISKLHFQDVNENFTGEDLALILATIMVYGAAQAAKDGVKLEIESTEGGKVHTATINDSVKMADGIGG